MDLQEENTYNAVISFQKANGLDADGMVGSATKAKLGITSSGGGKRHNIRYFKRRLQWFTDKIPSAHVKCS